MSSILLTACVYLQCQECLEGGHNLFLPSSRVSQQGSVDLQVGRGRALHLIPPLSPTSRTLAPPSSTAPAQTPAPASPPSSTPGSAPSPSSQLQARKEREPLQLISLPLTGGSLLVTRLLLLVLPGIVPPAVVVVPGNMKEVSPFNYFLLPLPGGDLGRVTPGLLPASPPGQLPAEVEGPPVRLPGLLQQEEGPLAGLPLLVEVAELVYRLEVVVDLGGKVNFLMGRYLLKSV